jgi:MFS family permease
MSENRRPALFYGYVVVAAAFLIMALMWGSMFSFAVFFEPLLDAFGWTRAMTSGAFSLALLLVGPFGILSGKLTDRFGPRIVATASALFLGSGFLLLSQMNTLWQLYLFYGMVGVGMSGSVVPMASTVARWFARRRGMMTGIALSGLGIGVLVIPALVSGLILRYEWRIAYTIVGIAVIILVSLTAQALRRDPARMGYVPYGEEKLTTAGPAPIVGFTLPEALRNRYFWMLAIALFGLSVSSAAIPAHIVLHAIGFGVSTTNAAVILSVIGGMTSVGRVAMGAVADRIGCKKALIISLLLDSAALFWLLTIRELWMFYAFAVVFGFSYGAAAALISPSVAEYFGLRSHGALLGVVMNGLQIIESIGMVLAGHIFDINGSYSPAFAAFAVAGLAGAVIIWFLPPSRYRVGR